jgi:flagellar hook-basal body complex protein FliE
MDSNKISSSAQPILPNQQVSPPVSKGINQVGKSFQESLEALTNDEVQSDNLLQQLATGENVDIHQAVIAAEETDINFRVAMAIRDRLVDAYREVMRMNI